MSKAIVYSGPACSWCERVKVLLQENDYEIEEKSIVNKGNVEEFQNKFNQTMRTVPQVVIDGELIGGFAEVEQKMKGTSSINKIWGIIMPLYEYRCEDCGNEFEEMLHFSER